MTKEIDLANDFSETPGGRFRSDGPHSGEEFRDDVLVPILEEYGEAARIAIKIDGVYGFPTSFLEETFGGLARKFGTARVLQCIEILTVDNPLIRDEIMGYIKCPDGKK